MVKSQVLDAINVKVAELARQIADAEKEEKSVGKLKKTVPSIDCHLGPH